MLGALTLLVLSASLTPDAKGHGTHTRLGLPACGFVVALNKPCITCGMTTSFALAANGRLGRAIVVQPAGALLAIFTASTVWIAGAVAVFGARVHEPFAVLLRPKPLLTFGAFVLAAWAFKWFTW
jgi:hypothetical protein